MKLFQVLIVVALGMLVTGCVTRIADFTIYSTKNCDVKKTLHTVDTAYRIKGKDVKNIALFIPLGLPNLKDAADNAEEQMPGCVGLSDVVVRTGNWYAILWGQTWLEIEGNPIIEVKDDKKQDK